jgi:hypothetical protein
MGNASEIKNRPKENIFQATQKINAYIFFHPDYTVGTGITPVHAIRLADFTAGRETLPALKISYSVVALL